MKTKSVLKRLGHFRSHQSNKGSIIFTSRSNDNRYVELIDQGGAAVTLPVIIDADGTQRVAYHPKTIQGLIDFLTGAK